MPYNFKEELDICNKIFADIHEISYDGVGVTRPAYSEKETLVLKVIEKIAKDNNFTYEYDKLQNLIITMEGSNKELPYIACGSHVDSVTQGGNYDGGAGVVAALAVLLHFKRIGFKPERTIKVFALRGEESARFGKAYMASLAMFGKLTKDDLELKDTDGKSMMHAMKETGVDTDGILAGKTFIDKNNIEVWMELHIEQGPVLLSENKAAGIVTGIRGNYRHKKIECFGEAGHSGADPMHLRKDAVLAVVDVISRMEEHCRNFLANNKDIVFTVGIIGTNPAEHAITRIPGYASFSFDVRSRSVETLNEFYQLFEEETSKVSDKRHVIFSSDRKIYSAPAVMDEKWVNILRNSAKTLDMKVSELPSGAGHDAAVFSNAGVPAAMIFIRNHNGSHNPQETIEIDDFVQGTVLLIQAVKEASK